jgi:predicted metal-dependent HD superfamily phosphohydrolase
MTGGYGALDSDCARSGAESEGPIALPHEQYELLCRAYRSPRRAYHHFGHVREVLEHYRAVADARAWHQPIEVWLAVLYHDAVYVPGRSDNEAASASLAVEHVARWWAYSSIDTSRVSDLILLTARHGSLRAEDFGNDAVGEDARLFLDCDMAILGSSSAAFAEYDRAIAEEYASVPRWLYRIKRRRFFKKLLASEWIFLSEYFREKYEHRARDNLAAALDGKISA